MCWCIQREVIVAIDVACRIHNEITFSMERFELGLEEVISKTHIKIIKSIKTIDFEKLLVVVNVGNKIVM